MGIHLHPPETNEIEVSKGYSLAIHLLNSHLLADGFGLQSAFFFLIDALSIRQMF